jgi:hypothetical protein
MTDSTHTNPAPSADAVAPTPELTWARGIADDFWEAMLNQEAEQAAGLLSRELARALITYQQWGGVTSEFKEVSPPACLTRIASQYGPETSITFNAADVAPNQSEVVFRGALTGKDRQGETVAAEFTMRVAQEEGGGRWCIRFFLVKERKS